MLLPSDLGLVLGDRFQKLRSEYESLEGNDDTESLLRREQLMREQAGLLCPGMPTDVLNALNFQTALGIVAVFLGQQGASGINPALQEILDRIQRPIGVPTPDA